MKRSKPMTAGEMIDKLAKDPEYQERMRLERIETDERIGRFIAAERPLVQALSDAGVKVTSAWDLVNTSLPYPKALPVLFEHLTMPYPDEIRAGIARALAVRDSAPGWDILAREYRTVDREAFPVFEDALAVALSAATDSSRMPDLIALLRTKSLGQSRVLLLDALRRSKLPEAKQAMDELSVDPQLAEQIAVYRHAAELREKRKARTKK